MRINVIARVMVLAFTVFGIGCATTNSTPRYSETDLELAQRHAEDETLARLASSVNTDIADAATSLTRQRATR
jgi:hypothetical protein